MDTNERQFAMLRDIDAVLRGAHIRYWLRGGWALDFILGQVTRPHGDVDLVTWKRHGTRIQRLFQGAGFAVSRVQGETAIDFAKHGIDVQVLFIERGPLGVYTAGYAGPLDEARWKADVLTGTRDLGGLRCRVISARGLLNEKEKTPGWLGRAPSAKDLEAAEILRRLLS